MEGCSAPKKVGKHETMEEDGVRRPARPAGQVDHHAGHHREDEVDLVTGWISF